MKVIFLFLISFNLFAINFENQREASRDWLNLKQGNDQRSIYHTQIEANGVALTLDNFLTSQNWKTHYIGSYSGTHPWPKGKSFIKTSQAPHQEGEKVSSAQYYISKGNLKHILSVSLSQFSIMYNTKDPVSYQSALKLKEDYSKYFAENSPYKSKALEFNGSLDFLSGVDDTKVTWKHFIFPQVTKSKIQNAIDNFIGKYNNCLLYTSPSPRDATLSRMPSSA